MIWWIILFGIAYLVWKYYKSLTYWKKRGITSLDAWTQIKMLYETLFRVKHLSLITREQYNMFPDERYAGVFSKNLLVKDLDLIKQITVKDFDHFTDHLTVIPPEVDPLLGRNLLSLKGQPWKEMRGILSPAFTSHKMKAMFVLMLDCAKDMTDFLFEKHQHEKKEIDMKDLFGRYTTDVIATTAFGIKCESLKEPENSFYLMGMKISNFSTLALIKIMMYGWLPKLMKFFKVRLLEKKISNFFTNIIMETVEKREKERIFRPDVLYLLMEAQKGNTKQENTKTKTEKHVTDEELTAQALVFFLGGFDTSSTVMSFTALELAVNPDVQQRLVDEIDENVEKYGEKIDYDVIWKMKYLDQVISEVLRKWTPGFQTDRVCVKDYFLEPVKPSEKQILIEKGVLITIPINAIHHDPKYWPNPEKFDPDRFSEENKDSIVPGSYLPFGIGPRNCIGSRFALLEVKILFYCLLSKFELVVTKQTPVPVKLDRLRFDLRPENGFWVGLKARKVTAL